MLSLIWTKNKAWLSVQNETVPKKMNWMRINLVDPDQSNIYR